MSETTRRAPSVNYLTKLIELHEISPEDFFKQLAVIAKKDSEASIKDAMVNWVEENKVRTASSTAADEDPFKDFIYLKFPEVLEIDSVKMVRKRRNLDEGEHEYSVTCEANKVNSTFYAKFEDGKLIISLNNYPMHSIELPDSLIVSNDNTDSVDQVDSDEKIAPAIADIPVDDQEEEVETVSSAIENDFPLDDDDDDIFG